MKWLQILFRILGIVAFAGSGYVFFDFGLRLLPLFEQFVAGTFDSFKLFTVLTSFFLGAPAFLWVSTRLILLRSFRSGWFYFAVLPLTVWLHELFAVGLIADMDQVLSDSVIYAVIYFVLLGLLTFVHAKWFLPVSHEKMGHVRLENPDRVHFPFLKTAGFIALFVGFVILHPADIATTLGMLLSPFSYLFTYIQSLI